MLKFALLAPEQAQAQAPSTAGDVRSYAEEQAARGDQLFTRVCLQCHTRRDMSSPDFKLKWSGQTAFDLFDLIRTTMPDSAPGTLAPAEYGDVTAYMMKLNGMRAGSTPLPLDSTLRLIKLDLPATSSPSSSVTSGHRFYRSAGSTSRNNPATLALSDAFSNAPRLPMSRSLPFQSRRSLSRGLMTTAAALSLAIPAVTQAQARQPIVPAGMSASPTLTPGIRIGDVVYSSGQLGMKRDAPDSTVGGQTTVALESIKAVFEAAGTTMAQAAKCTVFLIDVKDFGGMNTAYRAFFPTTPPARSTVVVAALVVAGAKVEIECVAAMPGK